MNAIVLKPGREKSILHRHPWIFSGAIQHADDNTASGETVNVLSSKGDFLARGAYSPHSQIRVRVWTFNNEAIDADFFRQRIHAALAARSPLLLGEGLGVRWHLHPLVPK